MCIPTLLSCPILYVQVGHHRDIWYEVELNSVIDSVTFSLLFSRSPDPSMGQKQDKLSMDVKDFRDGLFV